MARCANSLSRLDADGIAGWLATSRQEPDAETADHETGFELDLICKLTACDGDWQAAQAAFQRLRRAAQTGPSGGFGHFRMAG